MMPREKMTSIRLPTRHFNEIDSSIAIIAEESTGTYVKISHPLLLSQNVI